MPGCPFVYAGDEIGMRHLDVTSVEGGYQRTGARSPIQWDAAKPNYGFSGAPADALYISQDAGDDAPTVSAQMADDPRSGVRSSGSSRCAAPRRRSA